MNLYHYSIIQILSCPFYTLYRKVEGQNLFLTQKNWKMVSAKKKYLFIVCIIFCCINEVSAQSIDTVFHTGNSPLTYNSVNKVVTDSNKNIWIGTEYGLNRLNENGWQSWFAENSNLPDNAIRSLAVDKDNTLWMGVFQIEEEELKNNIAFHQNDNIQLFEKPADLSDFTRDILFIEDSVKTMFLATESGLGIYTFQNQNWSVYNSATNPYLVSQNITSVTYLPNDGIYAGTVNGGLVNLKDNGNIRVLFGEDTGLPDNTILDVAADTTGLLWLATPEGGLVSYNGQTFESINPDNSDMPTRSISSVVITAQNDNNSALLSNKINDLHLQNDSIIWAATDMGLARICTFEKMLSADTPSFQILETDLVYPNPSNGYLYVNQQHFLNQLIVYNILGEIVYTNSRQPNVNLSHIPVGSYLLKIKTKNTVYVQKIILSR